MEEKYPVVSEFCFAFEMYKKIIGIRTTHSIKTSLCQLIATGHATILGPCTMSLAHPLRFYCPYTARNPTASSFVFQCLPFFTMLRLLRYAFQWSHCFPTPRLGRFLRSFDGGTPDNGNMRRGRLTLIVTFGGAAVISTIVELDARLRRQHYRRIHIGQIQPHWFIDQTRIYVVVENPGTTGSTGTTDTLAIITCSSGIGVTPVDGIVNISINHHCSKVTNAVYDLCQYLHHGTYMAYRLPVLELTWRRRLTLSPNPEPGANAAYNKTTPVNKFICIGTEGVYKYTSVFWHWWPARCRKTSRRSPGIRKTGGRSYRKFHSQQRSICRSAFHTKQQNNQTTILQHKYYSNT